MEDALNLDNHNEGECEGLEEEDAKLPSSVIAPVHDKVHPIKSSKVDIIV